MAGRICACEYGDGPCERPATCIVTRGEGCGGTFRPACEEHARGADFLACIERSLEDACPIRAAAIRRP